MDGQDKRVTETDAGAASDCAAAGAAGDFAARPGDSKLPKIIDSFDVGVYAGKELYLEVEDGKDVFYHGDYVSQIVLDKRQELLVGRRDVMAGHYPDIDLAMYWKTDRSVSRRHLRFYFNMYGAFFVEDLCNNNMTFVGDGGRVLNRECAELKPGDRVTVSRSVVFVFKIR